MFTAKRAYIHKLSIILINSYYECTYAEPVFRRGSMSENFQFFFLKVGSVYTYFHASVNFYSRSIYNFIPSFYQSNIFAVGSRNASLPGSFFVGEFTPLPINSETKGSNQFWSTTVKSGLKP